MAGKKFVDDEATQDSVEEAMSSLALSSQDTSQPTTSQETVSSQYEVEKIMAVRTVKQYLIRWVGFDESHDEWVLEENISEDLVKQFNGKQSS